VQCNYTVGAARLKLDFLDGGLDQRSARVSFHVQPHARDRDAPAVNLAAEVEQGRADGQRQAVAVAGVGGVRSLKERPEADQFLLTVKASNPAKFHDASSRFLCPFVGLLCRTWTFYQTAGC